MKQTDFQSSMSSLLLWLLMKLLQGGQKKNITFIICCCIIIIIENLKESTSKLLEPIDNYRKYVGHKAELQSSWFLGISNNQWN